MKNAFSKVIGSKEVQQPSNMSFSKAKLKRFNEIQVTDSPYAERAGERKESIKNLMKELSRDAKSICSKDKSKESTAPAASDAESVKSTATESVFQRTRSLRLFRTPSLPKRLRFNRQHSDLTPKEKNTAAKTLFPQPAAVPVTSPIVEVNPEREALAAAQVEITNKTEVLVDQQQQLEELKSQLHLAQQQNQAQESLILQKNEIIEELETELRGNNEGIEMLRDIATKSCEKIESLEHEIRMVLRNHENEIDFLIRTNADVELSLERVGTEKKLLNEEVVVLKKELLRLHDEIRVVNFTLDSEVKQFNERDAECNRVMADNLQLLDEIDELKRQTDSDMLAYVEESQKMIYELDMVKRQNHLIVSDLALKEAFIRGLQEELASKDIDQDGVREELRDELLEDHKAEINVITKKCEQQIATLKEHHEMKVKEIESIHALERSKLINSHNEVVKKLQTELELSCESAEEKIRISEIQTEQRLKALESTIGQSIDMEKNMWKNEIDKCQKIAETEIMQCEFEKQDLKALLEAANELMREKDDRIEELQTQLGNELTKFVQCRDNFETEIKETRKECAKVMTEKYNYQLTLNNTRSTVTILMDRLKKSDSDVEILKNDVEILSAGKQEAESRCQQISEELQHLRQEADEYRNALNALRNSSLALEREIKEKESVFEQFMSSEENTLDTVSKIGKLFNDKIEENIGKYFHLYTELRSKYDAREKYILDMKTLMDEFGNGIQLARMELDAKETRLLELQNENKTIKLENLTYKFKCEQFEKYTQTKENKENNGKCIEEESGMVSNELIANIISQLENEIVAEPINMGLYSDEDKLSAQNNKLKEQLAEKSRQVDILQDIVNMENVKSTENNELKKKLANKKATQKKIESLKEANMQLEQKIANMQLVNKELENKLVDLKDVSSNEPLTPRKMNLSHSNINGTPKTPRTPKSYQGKENKPMAAGIMTHSPNVLRARNN